MIWMLCRLLPEAFRARQRGEWTGDLIAMATSGGGAGARWRYLFAAAWTLPSLRAHARKTGIDRPHPTLPPSVPAGMLARVIVGGLGSAVVAWLLAMPGRYYLMDFPYRLSDPGAIGLPFDPKEAWPVDGPLLIPLWVVLGAGSYVFVIGWVALVWMSLAVMLLGPTRRGASGRQRWTSGLLGAAIAAFGIVTSLLDISRQVDFLHWNDGLTAAVMGTLAVVFGVTARRLPRRTRAAVLVVGLAAVAIHFWYYTPLGAKMLNWYYD